MAFNDFFFYGRRYDKPLDNITYIKTIKSQDRFLNAIINSLLKYDWVGKYNLGFNDVMNLEYPLFILLEDKLKQHTTSENTTNSIALNNIDNQFKQGNVNAR